MEGISINGPKAYLPSRPEGTPFITSIAFTLLAYPGDPIRIYISNPNCRSFYCLPGVVLQRSWESLIWPILLPWLVKGVSGLWKLRRDLRILKFVSSNLRVWCWILPRSAVNMNGIFRNHGFDEYLRLEIDLQMVLYFREQKLRIQRIRKIALLLEISELFYPVPFKWKVVKGALLCVVVSWQSSCSLFPTTTLSSQIPRFTQGCMTVLLGFGKWGT